MRSKAWISSFKWGGAVFVVTVVSGAVLVRLCAQTQCFANQGEWGRYALSGFFILAVPWALVFSPSLFSGHLTGLTGALLLSTAAGASAGLLALFARLWYLRFRNFLAAPLPQSWEPEPRDEAHLPPPLGRGLLSLSFVVGILIASGIVLAKHGLRSDRLLDFLTVLGAIILLSLIPFYFELRRSQKPNRLEVALAFAWLMLRRVAGGTAALLFALGSIAAFRSSATWAATALAIVALVVSWWTWVGPGHSRRFSDDLPAHRARKRRYGWK